MSEWLGLEPQLIAIGIAVTFVAATVQATIGVGFAICSVSILSLVDPRLAPAPQLLIALPLTLSMAFRERASIQTKGIFWIMAGRLPGTGAGVALLTLATKQALDLLIGGAILLAAGILATGASIPRNPKTEFAAGFTSAVSAMVSSIGGPPLAMLYRGSSGPVLRANMAVVFTLGLLLTIGGRLSAGALGLADLKVALALSPGLILGVYCSKFLMGRVEGRPLKMGILIVCALAAAGILVKTLVA